MSAHRGDAGALDDAIGSPWRELSGYAIVALWASVLFDAVGGVESATWPAVIALALYAALHLRALRPLTYAYLIAAALLAAAGVFTGEKLPLMVEGLRRACFIALLPPALALLSEPGRGSPSIIAAGQMLVLQPPGRRYVALTAGSSLFGAALNFGAISLLTGMAKQANTLAAAQGRESVRRVREKRMMLAILRGFTTIMFWCPLTAAFAFTATILTDASILSMSLLGGLMTIIVMLAGWLLDRRGAPSNPSRMEVQPFRWRALMPIVAVVIAVSGVAVAIEMTTSAQLIHGVLLGAPVVAALWLFAIHGGGALIRLSSYATIQIPWQRNEIVLLAGAAFAGTMLGGMIPEGGLDHALSSRLVPLSLVAPLVLAGIVLLGQIGINPMLTVAALGPLAAAFQAHGGSPTVLAMGIVFGWGLALCSSPSGVGVMLIGRLTGHGAQEVGLRWNGAYTVVAICCCSLLLIPITWVL